MGRGERRLQLVFCFHTRDKIEGLGLGKQREREEKVTSCIFDGSQSFPVSSSSEENSSNQWEKNKGLLTRVFFSTKQAKNEKNNVLILRKQMPIYFLYVLEGPPVNIEIQNLFLRLTICSPGY